MAKEMRRKNRPSFGCAAASTVRRLTCFRLAGNNETPDIDCSKHPHVRIERVKRLRGNLASIGVQLSIGRKGSGRKKGFSGGVGVVFGAGIEHSLVATDVLSKVLVRS